MDEFYTVLNRTVLLTNYGQVQGVLPPEDITITDLLWLRTAIDKAIIEKSLEESGGT